MSGALSAHVQKNMWLWIVIFLGLTAFTGTMRYFSGAGAHWGDLMALSGATLGGLIMMKSANDGADPLIEDDAA